MVADRDREIGVLKEITRKTMVGTRLRPKQVADARGRGLSTRRDCAVLSVARSTLGYASRLAVRDAPVVAVAQRPQPLPPAGIDHMWADDFVFDTCANRRTLKCLTVVDKWTRESLEIDVAGGIRSGRVIEMITRLVSLHGAPSYLRSDVRPEFVATKSYRLSRRANYVSALIAAC